MILRGLAYRFATRHPVRLKKLPEIKLQNEQQYSLELGLIRIYCEKP